MRTAAAPTPAPAVAEEFLFYLQVRKGWDGLGYVRAPEPVLDGWETYTYRLQLRGGRGLPGALLRPLALRVYAGPEGLPALRRDWAWQRRLCRKDFPVARPLLREEDPTFLGGPFLLREWAEGETMFSRLARDYLAFAWAPWQLADLHARLHRTPARGLPAPARPLLDRELDEFEAAAAVPGLGGLAAGVEWLRKRRPPDAEPPCPVHLDLHPKNVIVRGRRCAAVLDWSECDLGDRHADVAMTLLHMKTSPVDVASPWTRLVLPAGRDLARMMFYNGYRRLLPIDRDRVRYYQAWAAMRRLSRYGLWVLVGPHLHHHRPDARMHVRADHVAAVEREFERHSGVAARLGLSVP
jgi:aminoglycoside phosphotransferase (APT) family kinase protein